MAIEIPQSRGLRQIQTQKRNIPLEQIIAIQGQNPVAQGITEASNVIGQTLQRRAELQRQGQELAKLESLAGQAPGSYSGLDLSTASPIAMAQIKEKAEGKKVPLGQPFNDKEGNAFQYFFDNKTQKTTAEPLPKGIPPPKESPATSGTLVQSGLFDANGQPIMVNNKTGKPMTIATGGGNQTKTMLTPTSQARSAGEFAATIIPHIDDLKTLISQADAKGYIGPLGGRYQNFMTGKVGTTGDKDADYMLGKLKSTRDFLATGTMKAHVGARGGGDLLEHFLSDMDTGKQSAQVLYGELDALKPFMEGYVAAGKGGRPSLPTLPAPLTGAKKSLADKLGL